MHFYLGGGSSILGSCENCSSNWLDGGVLMRIARAPHGDASGNDEQTAGKGKCRTRAGVRPLF
jgi:hypothetical protein